MMSHVFISYSRVDQAYARQLGQDLRQRGFDVWIDDRIDYGDRWWHEIVKAIEGCGAVIVIMSPEAESSEWVERELLLAQRSNKPIFPLLLRGQEFPLLITTQFVDVRRGALPPDDYYQRLAQAVPPRQRPGRSLVAPRKARPARSGGQTGVWLALLLLVAVAAVVAVIALLNPFSPPSSADAYLTTLTERLNLATDPNANGSLPMLREFWGTAGEPGDNPNCGHRFDFGLFVPMPEPPEALAGDPTVREMVELLNEGLGLLRDSAEIFLQGCEQANLPARLGEGHDRVDQAALRLEEAAHRLEDILQHREP